MIDHGDMQTTKRPKTGVAAVRTAATWLLPVILLAACQTPTRTAVYTSHDLDDGRRSRVWTQDLVLKGLPRHPRTGDPSTVSLATTFERGKPATSVEIRVRTFPGRPSGVTACRIGSRSLPVLTNIRELDRASAASQQVEEWWIVRASRSDLVLPSGAASLVLTFEPDLPSEWRVRLPRQCIGQFLKSADAAKTPPGGE
jgi:hypothetical protein